MLKTATQETLDKIREAYEKKVSSVTFGYGQDLKEHYDIIQTAQRTKDDADWIIRCHQTMADKIRLEQHDRLEEVRVEYEHAVASFLNTGEVPDGWEAET